MMQTAVLIIGAGPVGLVLAKELARHGVRSMLIERNLETTRWPKMDITNCRSMELLRRLGLDQRLRQVGVPTQYSFDVLFATGLDGHQITRWDLPSPDRWQQRIAASNDGTLPQVAYQRCSQEVFEAWMKQLCVEDPLIDVRAGWRFDALSQDDSGVTATVTHTVSGQTQQIRAQYLVGCDGGASAVRKSIGIALQGHAAPRRARQVHFKSRDLTALHRHGQFWHIFFTTPATIIAQDEVDTWTIQRYFPPEFDPSDLDSEEVITGALGKKIAVDKILVSSVWQPQLLLADRYVAGRVILAGDSAHQNIPTGGYGMNTGTGDATDIGWMLAGLVQGWGGAGLLQAYEDERRPVAERNVARSERHANIHVRWRARMNETLVHASTPEGAAHRAELGAFIQQERGENEEHGIELGYRYEQSAVIRHEGGAAPHWEHRNYVPTTWPGGRPPSVHLADGSDLFDRLGPQFTLVDFSACSGSSGSAATSGANDLRNAAKACGLPMQYLPLHDPHARGLWERDLVLVRPDQHVAWRGNAAPADAQALMDQVRGMV